VRAYTSLRDVGSPPDGGRGRDAAPAPRAEAKPAPAPLFPLCDPSRFSFPFSQGDAMAIFRLSASVVKRSAGRSILAAAAYRSGSLLNDDRLGQSFDYRRRRGVEHEAILAPEHAPAWMTDRERLWNGVEAAEKRKDGQLAREVQFALPHELTEEQRLALVTAFVRDEFVSKGMVADLVIHAPDRGGDERNHHAHVTLTMREIDGDGFGKKNRDWNRTDQLQEWREHWAEQANLALERAGHDARIDHRSLEAQGIDREAQPKLGPAATEMERRGIETELGDQLRAVLERNADRAILVGELAATAKQEAEAERAMPAADLSPAKAPKHDGLDLAAGGLGAALGKLADIAEGLMAPPSPAEQVVAKHVAIARHEAEKEARHIAAEPLAAPAQEKPLEPPRLELPPMERLAEDLRQLTTPATPQTGPETVEQEVERLMATRNSRDEAHKRHRDDSGGTAESVEDEVARLMLTRNRERTRGR
jgi:MobA/MobL family